MPDNDVVAMLRAFLTAADADVFVYCGDITTSGYDEISRLCREEKRKERALLVLSTVGGDANAGYRIARALTHHYGKFSVFIPGYCKSAGTLVTLGADELIMGNQSELGPLDIQVRKPDEIFDMGSGLDIVQGLNFLQTQAFAAFRQYLIQIKASGVSTKLAADVAAEFAVGLFAPIYEQVDPVRVGELQRATAIAFAYGERLADKSKNLHDGAVTRLVTTYPSHAFVIDRKEARSLFKNIRAASAAEEEVGRICCTQAGGAPQVYSLNTTLEKHDEQTRDNAPAAENADAVPAKGKSGGDVDRGPDHQGAEPVPGGGKQHPDPQPDAPAAEVKKIRPAPDSNVLARLRAGGRVKGA